MVTDIITKGFISIYPSNQGLKRDRQRRVSRASLCLSLSIHQIKDWNIEKTVDPRYVSSGLSLSIHQIKDWNLAGISPTTINLSFISIYPSNQGLKLPAKSRIMRVHSVYLYLSIKSRIETYISCPWSCQLLFVYLYLSIKSRIETCFC